MENTMANRCKAVRIMAGYDQHLTFAQRLGIQPGRWGNFERGLPLSIEVARMLITEFHGLTLDWLFVGNEGGLTVEMQRRLRAIMAQPDEDGSVSFLDDQPPSSSARRAI